MPYVCSVDGTKISINRSDVLLVLTQNIFPFNYVSLVKSHRYITVELRRTSQSYMHATDVTNYYTLIFFDAYFVQEIRNTLHLIIVWLITALQCA